MLPEHDRHSTEDLAAYEKEYFGRLRELLDNVDPAQLDAVVSALLQTRRSDGVVYVIGNGGSAATASHMVNDLCKFVCPRSGNHFRAYCLADNTPWITALANDEGYDRIFASQIERLARPGDLVVGISASGDSANMIAAFVAARSKGARTAAIVGFSGGEMAKTADSVLHVRSEHGEYGPVEDAHAIISHLIANYLARVLGE